MLTGWFLVMKPLINLQNWGRKIFYNSKIITFVAFICSKNTVKSAILWKLYTIENIFSIFYCNKYIKKYFFHVISAEYWTCSWNISYYQCWKPLKGIVHPKTTIILSFTHPQVVPNLFEFLSFAEHKRRYFEECGQPRCRWINNDVGWTIPYFLWKL